MAIFSKYLWCVIICCSFFSLSLLICCLFGIDYNCTTDHCQYHLISTTARWRREKEKKMRNGSGNYCYYDFSIIFSYIFHSIWQAIVTRSLLGHSLVCCCCCCRCCCFSLAHFIPLTLVVRLQCRTVFLLHLLFHNGYFLLNMHIIAFRSIQIK